MRYSRNDLLHAVETWLEAWSRHDLDSVFILFHEDIVFENWTGAIVAGKERLRKAWRPWFATHGNFRFSAEDLFADEEEQKVLYRWSLEWPSQERGHHGKTERRRGVDVLHFKEGKIVTKLSYSKTTILIEGKRVALSP